MRAWIIAAALAFAPSVSFASPIASPAPLPEGAIAVEASQNGQTIEANAGGGVAIQLTRNSSAGTSWRVAAKPDFLADPEMLTGPTMISDRPILGAPSWQVFVFPVSEAGSGEIALEKTDRGGAVLETFTVTINAQ